MHLCVYHAAAVTPSWVFFTGSVAQLAEQGTENPRVGGSIPSRAILPALAQQRGVAQPGRAPALGAGCRRFESCRPDYGLGPLKFGDTRPVGSVSEQLLFLPCYAHRKLLSCA